MKPPPRIIALMYHRIDEPDTDPWGICVSPIHFEEQIVTIKKHFPVITADNAVQQLIKGTIAESSVCITFDDGYADNYTNALPVLQRYDCPATFFVATAFTGSFIPFWWDELEMICLHKKRLPSQLALPVEDAIHHFSFETELTEQQWRQHCEWRWHEDAPTTRCRSFLDIWTLLRPLPDKEIKTKMTNIRLWAQAEHNSRLPLSEYQLQKLSQDNLSSIGLHTHTHINLACHSMEEQIKDIRMNKDKICERYGIHNSIISYPYGSYNKLTLSALAQANIKGGFTTSPEIITAGSDIKQLGRFQVFNRNQRDFEAQLLKWMTG